MQAGNPNRKASPYGRIRDMDKYGWCDICKLDRWDSCCPHKLCFHCETSTVDLHGNKSPERVAEEKAWRDSIDIDALNNLKETWKIPYNGEIGPDFRVYDVPEGAFENAWDYSSLDWESWFPDHCYICHVAYEGDEDGKDDTSRCGPHCKGENEIHDNS